MAWCPVCKCEYKEGIEKCADCKVKLVESLECIPVSEEDKLQMLVEEETMTVAETMAMAEEISTVHVAKKTGVYRKSDELSSENKSSAYILLSIGILGIIALVLICLNIIPLYTGIVSKITSSIILGTLFVVFIVMGIISLKSAKVLSKKAAAEGDLTIEIIDYMSKNYSKVSIDETLSDEVDWNENSEEVKYFKRIEYIKHLITNKFMNLEEDYVDYVCDEIYTDFYEE